MPQVILSFILAGVFSIVAESAAARCQGMIVLMGIHDNYRATLLDTDAAQTRAAKALLVGAGGLKSERLAAQVAESGVVLAADHLETVLRDALELGTSVLSGSVDEFAFKHSQNVAWLEKQTAGSQCSNSITSDERIAVSAPENVRAHTKNRFKNVFDNENAPSLVTLAGFALLGLCGTAAYFIRRSVAYKKRTVARLPRKALAIALPITFTDADGNMQQTRAECVDISVGGLKLRWDDPPAKGAFVTVSLDIGERLGTIVWSNQFFAGIAFDAAITKAQLSSLLERQR